MGTSDDDVAAPFWAAVRDRGVLAMQRCLACAHIRYPVSTLCPRCLHDGYEWQDLSGRGTVLSSVTFHRAYRPEWSDLVPYDVLFVELDEGPRMFSAPAPARREGFAVGQRVRVVPAELPPGEVVPCFERADEEVAR
ncbi:OB-fold domain-containing protein [Dactylosporangium sp. AC04546]|uniref:Zn-ribbon domain-containing OB-fold protein n=1 Tax=Dactylosporangium sp. AC04546 TaxID=2862460 RepID=UPI001EE131FA|nr:OB-fold domain-containing protein [Dactylosporangium sp. AC04546]WVK78764.1 OB-fold domain-containing protein [Dactylosporangium sp. AC04546]